MNLEKIESLRKGVLTTQLIEQRDEIFRYASNHEQTDKFLFEITAVYFRDLVKSIFDVFICEGGDDSIKFIQDSIGIYYFNIYYSYLKEVFINNKDFKKYFETDKDKINSLYLSCEDMFFNFAAFQYYSVENTNAKMWERFLKVLQSTEASDQSKMIRYKKILFMYYKKYKTDCLMSEITRLNEQDRELNRQITIYKKEIKTIKTIYFEYKVILKKQEEDNLENKLKERKEYFEEFLNMRNKIHNLQKTISSTKGILSEMAEDTYKISVLTEEEFLEYQKSKFPSTNVEEY